jgi:hypothetical protein
MTCRISELYGILLMIVFLLSAQRSFLLFSNIFSPVYSLQSLKIVDQ